MSSGGQADDEAGCAGAKSRLLRYLGRRETGLEPRTSRSSAHARVALGAFLLIANSAALVGGSGAGSALYWLGSFAGAGIFCAGIAALRSLRAGRFQGPTS
jgi:hypothetical protein